MYEQETDKLEDLYNNPVFNLNEVIGEENTQAGLCNYYTYDTLTEFKNNNNCLNIMHLNIHSTLA
jgi:hypothetical protein